MVSLTACLGVSHQATEETGLRDTNFLTNDENAVETSLAHAKGEAIIRKNLSHFFLLLRFVQSGMTNEWGVKLTKVDYK